MTEVPPAERERKKVELYNLYDSDRLKNKKYNEMSSEEKIEYIGERRKVVESQLKKYIEEKK